MERSEAYFHAHASVDESNFNFSAIRWYFYYYYFYYYLLVWWICYYLLVSLFLIENAFVYNKTVF